MNYTEFLLAFANSLDQSAFFEKFADILLSYQQFYSFALSKDRFMLVQRFYDRNLQHNEHIRRVIDNFQLSYSPTDTIIMDMDSNSVSLKAWLIAMHRALPVLHESFALFLMRCFRMIRGSTELRRRRLQWSQLNFSELNLSKIEDKELVAEFNDAVACDLEGVERISVETFIAQYAF